MKKLLFIFLIIFITASHCFSQLDTGEEPLDVVLLIDTSKSVDNLPEVKKALHAWMKKALKKGDRVCVMKFANKPLKSSTFTITGSNLNEVVKVLPNAPDPDGNFTDLSAAIMESLLVLTDYYYNPPPGTTEKRKQYMIVVSDFINDPPLDSLYYDPQDTPYLKYKEAKDKCLNGGDEFPLLNVTLKPFVLTAPVDSIGGGEIDEWWEDFLKSLGPVEKPQPTPTTAPAKPTPTALPVEDKGEIPEEYKELIEKLMGEYENEVSELKVDIIPVEESFDLGKVPPDGIVMKKDFELVCSHKFSNLKDISIKVLVEGFRPEGGSKISSQVVKVKFMDSSIDGMEIKDETLSIASISNEEADTMKFPLSVEISIQGIKKSDKVPKGKIEGKLVFEIKAMTNVPDIYEGQVISEIGLNEGLIKEIFSVKELEKKESFKISFLYEKPVNTLFLIIILSVLFAILLLLVLLVYLSASGKPVSVSLRMEGMPPVIHTYELTRKGFIEIKGGSFITPDQFELPDFEGLAATIHRRGVSFVLIPDKACIINDSGEPVNVEKKINPGDNFTLRVDRISGGTTDFHFVIQKASSQDWEEESEIDNILDDGQDIPGKVDTGDLL